MPFQLSPGVLVKEVDLTNIVPSVATSIGAVAGAFEKGPVGEIVPVGSEKELVSILVNQTEVTLRHGSPLQTSCSMVTHSGWFVQNQPY